MIIAKSIEAFYQVKEMKNVKEEIIFFDRSFLEGISYYQTLNIPGSNKYDHIINELRYYSTIFMMPPWKEIFSQDAERKHSFEDAVEEYERLLESYPKYGYRLIELPKINVTERVKFILSTIGLVNF